MLTLIGAGLFSILNGPISIGAADVFKEIASQVFGVTVTTGLTELQSSILTDIRLPRVVLGMIAGGTPAGAGGAYHGVFLNPLVDPGSRGGGLVGSGQRDAAPPGSARGTGGGRGGGRRTGLPPS